jgi:hypothetical protein
VPWTDARQPGDLWHWWAPVAVLASHYELTRGQIASACLAIASAALLTGWLGGDGLVPDSIRDAVMLARWAGAI